MASPTKSLLPNYGQFDSQSVSYGLGGELPPEIALEQQALNRRQHIANLLLQQGMQAPAPFQQAGRFIVPMHWSQGMNQLAQVLAGSYLTNRNDQARERLEGDKQAMVARAVQQYVQGTQGTPERTLPEGVAGPVNPALPPSDSSKREAIINALTSRIPGLQAIAQADYAAMNKPPEHYDLGDKIVIVQNGQVVGQMAKGATPDAALKETGANVRHTTPSGDAVLKEQGATQRHATVSGDTLAKEAGAATRHATASGDTLAKEAGTNQRYGTVSANVQAQEAGAMERHRTASGSALAHVDAQTQISLQAHQDRQAQLDQNIKHDRETLELRKQQGLSEEQYRRDKMAMEERHAKAQEALQKERNAIEKSFKEAQKEKNSKTQLSPTAQKELFEADDTINAANTAMEALDAAMKMNEKAYDGVGALSRAKITSNIPLVDHEAANATVDLDNIVTSQALTQLKTAFGGMPTEGERKILLDVQGSVNLTKDQRKAIWERAKKALERRRDLAQTKAKQLREGTYFSEQGGLSTAPTAPPPPADKSPRIVDW